MNTMLIPVAKTCTKCNEIKAFTEFYKDPVREGLRAECKACIKAYTAAYRAANREQSNAYTVAYYAANKEQIKARKAAYYITNKERIKVTYRADLSDPNPTGLTKINPPPHPARCLPMKYPIDKKVSKPVRGIFYDYLRSHSSMLSEQRQRECNVELLLHHMSTFDKATRERAIKTIKANEDWLSVNKQKPTNTLSTSNLYNLTDNLIINKKKSRIPKSRNKN